MANEVKLTFAGDAKSLDRTFSAVESGARSMGDSLEDAARDSSKFGGAVSGMNSKIDASESKFMGAADLVDGLSAAFGISLGPTVEYARAFGDMAGGFTATLGPAMEGIQGKLGKLTIVTKAQSVAQAALNGVMSANPIMLTVIALAALTAGFVIAYKKSETFRNIVHAAMDGVRKAIGGVGDKASWLGDKIAGMADRAVGVFRGLANAITSPYRAAFNGIAWAWNNTVGRLSFSIPGWVPGIGGNGFDVPDIPSVPAFANGGIARGGQMALVGERGPELFVPGITGRVIPNNALGGGATIIIKTGAGDLDELIRKRVRVLGGNVQTAFGSA